VAVAAADTASSSSVATSENRGIVVIIVAIGKKGRRRIDRSTLQKSLWIARHVGREREREIAEKSLFAPLLGPVSNNSQLAFAFMSDRLLERRLDSRRKVGKDSVRNGAHVVVRICEAPFKVLRVCDMPKCEPARPKHKPIGVGKESQKTVFQMTE
jgi:hypothetical protein